MARPLPPPSEPSGQPDRAASPTDAFARARADLDTGRAWKARDRLTGLLCHRQDSEVLDLLATVHYEMHNLPAAGALWFVTGRDDEIARTSIAAWRERYGNDEARWLSIPAPVRERARAQHLRALEGAAKRTASGRKSRWDQAPVYTAAWWEDIVFVGGAIVFLLVVVALVGIGVWTVAQWIWS